MSPRTRPASFGGLSTRKHSRAHVYRDVLGEFPMGEIRPDWRVRSDNLSGSKFSVIVEDN
jgi:hypothetical protein